MWLTSHKTWILLALLLFLPVVVGQEEGLTVSSEIEDIFELERENLRKIYPHKYYDWWDYEFEIPPIEYASCPACHESLGGRASRKKCEDCHLPYASGPFQAYRPAGLTLKENYSAPLVYYHVQGFDDPNPEIEYQFEGEPIWVKGQSAEFGGDTLSSCFGYNPNTGEGTCHGITSQKPVDGYFALNATKLTRDSPYQYMVSKENLPDGTKCLYCHRQEDLTIVRAWGDPEQIAIHFNATKDEECYECHVVGKTKPISFHVMGPMPKRVNITEVQSASEEEGFGSTESYIATVLVLSTGIGIYIFYRKK
jgi:hypothetical protein